MRKTLMTSFAVAALALTGVASFAEDAAAPSAPPPPPAPSIRAGSMRSMMGPCIAMALRVIGQGGINRIAVRLKLSEAERAKVTDLITKAEETGKPLIDAQRKAAEEFANAMVKEETTEASLTALAEAAMKAETAAVNYKIKVLFALEAILTPQQKTDLLKMLELTDTPALRNSGGGLMPPGMVVPPAAPEPPKPADADTK